MDLLLTDSGNGGELSLNSGDLATDDTFFTAVYLSLFTGDTFSNVYEKYKTDRSFEEALLLPITKNNLLNVEKTCKNSLNWFILEGIAKSIDVFAYGNTTNKIGVDITITEPSDKNYFFSIIWENEKYKLKVR